MILFVPTFKRTEILPIILKSILNADTQGIDERILILIHNNNFADKKVIEELISSLNYNIQFSLKAIHRKDPAIPLEGWFEAIFSTALQDETIIMLGDDDILTPWGIRNRYREINRLRADLMISDFAQRVYFFDGGAACWPDVPDFMVPNGEIQAKNWEYSLRAHRKTAAIHNHCFRNTISFRKAVEQTFGWCEQQTWSPRFYSTGLIPSYLPYSVQSVGGKAVWLPEVSVIRGGVFQELLHQDYSDGGSTSFYALLTVNTFNQAPFLDNYQRYEELRLSYLEVLSAGMAEAIRNPNIKWSMITEGFRDSGLNLPAILLKSFFNWRELLRMIPIFKGWRLKRVHSTSVGLISTDSFLQKLRCNERGVISFRSS